MAQLRQWRSELLTRRQALLRLAGGSLALLLPVSARAQLAEADSWRLIDALQQRLLPSEPDRPGAPGAKEINALAYLQWVVADAKLDAEERAFLLRGAGWLEDLCLQRLGRGFVSLSPAEQDQMLSEVAQSAAGENWINSQLSYLLEALLSDPIYGGNRAEQGWRWLGHRPGFPRPNRDTCYRAG